jgi:zinc protease
MYARIAFFLLVAACASSKPAATVPAPPPGSAEVSPAVATATPAATRPSTPAATRVRTVEGITEYRLDNGLVVLLFPDETQSTITVNITYLVGSRHEGYGETGMAHLLEHMLFKGTTRHRNVLKLLDERGGQANGTTWLDRTNYYETLPASPENLEWTLDLEADRMRNATISAEDLKTEFSVVRNEFEMGESNPQGVLDERIVSAAFLWHNYGKSTIGSRADIERVPVTALRAFYDKYYQPDNAVLVVSGKFDEATALAAVENHFGRIAKPQRELTPPYTVEPVQDGERRVTLRRAGDVHVIGLAYHTVAGATDDFPAVEAALDVLVREPSGRLYKQLVETKLAASVSGWNHATHDPYLAQITAQIRDGKNLAKAEQILIKEIEALGQTKPDDKAFVQAVERWRVATLKDLELGLADSRQLAILLSESAALGDWRTLFAYRKRVETVTPGDVVRVARTFFKSSNRTVGTFVPTKDADRAPLTETPDVASWVKGIEGGDVKEQGEAFVATLDTIEQRTQRVQLAGGVRAALLPKKTRGGKVKLMLRLHWGDEKSLQGKATAATLMGPLMMRGTTKKTYQELQDLENALKARIWIDSSATGMTLNIETVRDKLPGALDLAFEMLTSPAFPAKQLELVRQEQLAALEEQLQDPMTSAFTTFGQLTTKWPKTDPRYSQTVQEQLADIKKAGLAEITRFYRDVAGAGHGELAVVGDFDPATITARVEGLAKSWKSKQAYTRLPDKAFGVPGTSKVIDIKDKEMTAIALGLDVEMTDSDPDYPAWLMLSQVLGGDTGSRVWMRLREKDGLSYGASTWAFADSFDPAGGFGGYAIVAPQNVAKARAALLEEIEKIRTGKVTDAELRRAKDGWVKDQDTSLSNDGHVVRMLAGQEYKQRTTAWSKQLRAKVEAVTPADIARVATKHLDPKRLVIVEAGDVAKQSAN